jgi:Ni/Co efflux regulator RcnB
MTRFKFSSFALFLLFVVAFLSAGSAFAERSSWSGGSKHDKHRKKQRYSHSIRHDDPRDGRKYYQSAWNDYRDGRYFAGRDRTIVRDYYVNDFRRGFCPPGLAKKNNGCMPPGQAKKWAIGRPLPRGLAYYDLPPHLAMSIGMPPPGYEFVRVASDILMIAVGTGIVVDAINDLGR